MLAEQLRSWRYHLSRLGVAAYLAGLRRECSSYGLGTPVRQCLVDPRSLLRAILFSLR
jgi:hypothetical protein